VDLALIVRRLIGPAILAVMALQAGQAFAQTEPMDQACKQAFEPLREEVASRGRLIKAASERHAPPDEACKLIGDFVQSEIRMIKFLEANSDGCGISRAMADQIKTGHRKTEALQKEVCALAQQGPRPRPQGPTFAPAGPVGDFDKVR
jgi:hypothetical protein